jgi:hypothetical protein
MSWEPFEIIWGTEHRGKKGAKQKKKDQGAWALDS